MPKSNLISLLLATVSIAGLASCAKDHGTKGSRGSSAEPVGARAAADRFHPPVIVSARGNRDIPVWDKEESEVKELGLNDVFDLSSSRPASVEVNARCGQGASEIISNAYFEREDRISIARLLPIRVLTRDLAKTPTQCLFMVQMSDGLGARHGYLASARIIDDDAPGVVIEPGQNTDPRQLLASQMAALKLRYDYGGPMWARVACGDKEFPPLKFERALDTGMFDVKAISAAFQKSPRQTCRFIVDREVPRSSGSNVTTRAAVSNLMNVQFGDSPWWIERLTAPVHHGYMDPGGHIVIADLAIHNLSTQGRTLRFAKNAYEGVLQVFASDPTYAEVLPKPWVWVFQETPAGSVRLTGQSIFVKPGQMARIKFKFISGHSLRCPYVAINARFNESVFFEDVGPSGETLASVLVSNDVPGKLRVNPDFEIKDGGPTPAPIRFCQWD